MAFLRKGVIELLDLIPAIYCYVFGLDYKYNIFTGAKHTGKTYAITLIILLKMLFRKNIDVLVLRKYNKDHLSSTYKQFKKIIHILDKLLKPFGYKFLENFKFIKQPNPVITYLPTGQEILFAGMDDPGRVAGLTTDTPDKYLGIVYVEEPIEVSDMKSTTPQQQELIAINFETILDSVFRADETIKDPFYQVYMSMNMWNFLQSWVKKEYPYEGNIKWDDEQTIQDLETKGWIKYEDPNYESGAGIILLHTSFKVLANAKLLPENKIAVHEKRGKYNPEMYKLISLGIPEPLDSLPMAKYDGRIPKEVPKEYIKLGEKLIPTDIGVDIGQLQDDSAFAVFKNKIINGKIVRDAMIIDGKYSFNIPANLSMKEQAKKLLNRILEMAKEYPSIEDYGIRLWLHWQADAKLYEPFEEIKTQLEIELNTNLKWIRIRKAPNPAKAENVIGKRIQRWKMVCEKEKFICEWNEFYKDFINMEVDQYMKRVEDLRRMDLINAGEQYLNTFFNQHKSYWKKENEQLRLSRTLFENKKKKYEKIAK